MIKNIKLQRSYNEYKDVLLNNSCLRDSMNKIQSKDHSTGTHEITKISQSCFDDKVYIKIMDMMN